jgi:sugar phosphate isomerase/epimerase
MKIKFFCPRWGSEHINWEDFFQKVKSAGYDGIEWGIPASATTEELDAVWALGLKHELLMIAQHYDTNDTDFDEHFQAYESWLNKIRKYPWHKISSQTGKDFFSFDQNRELIGLGNTFGAIHETHRGKFSFAAHITKTYLEKIPRLRLTLDASHWVNVAESFLMDQPEVMQLAIERTDHIHARVGFPEGPQVTDPRLLVWQQALDTHLRWWDRVVAHNPSVSFTTEFGPFPYMVPEQNNQWEINCFMLELLRKRYNTSVHPIFN